VVQDQPEQIAPQFIPIPEVMMESVEGSPPSTEDDRRMGPADTVEDMQGGPVESKLPGDNGAEDGMDINAVDHSPDTDMKQLLRLMQREHRVETEEANDEILAVIKSLGGDKGKYRREAIFHTFKL
jgi:hypothetical protein